MTPVSRTLKALRRAGWLADVVEKWIPHTTPPKRRDLFGVADVIAVHPVKRQFLLVQVTVQGSVSARVKKCRQSAPLAVWLEAGGLFQVWGWTERADGWKAKIVSLTGELIDAVVIQSPRRRRPSRFEEQRELFQ